MLWHVSGFHSFLRLCNTPLYVHTAFCLSIHCHEPFDSFYIGAFVSNTAMNTSVLRSVWVFAFSSLQWVPSSANVGSCGNSTFQFLRNLHTVSHSFCAILYSHCKCNKDSNFSSSLTTRLFAFDDNYPKGMSGISLWLWFAFSQRLVMLSSF